MQIALRDSSHVYAAPPSSPQVRPPSVRSSVIMRRLHNIEGIDNQGTSARLRQASPPPVYAHPPWRPSMERGTSYHYPSISGGRNLRAATMAQGPSLQWLRGSQSLSPEA